MADEPRYKIINSDDGVWLHLCNLDGRECLINLFNLPLKGKMTTDILKQWCLDFRNSKESRPIGNPNDRH